MVCLSLLDTWKYKIKCYYYYIYHCLLVKLHLLGFVCYLITLFTLNATIFLHWSHIISC